MREVSPAYIDKSGQSCHFGRGLNRFNFRTINEPMVSAERMKLIADGGKIIGRHTDEKTYEQDRHEIAATNLKLAETIQLLGTLPPELLAPQTPSEGHRAA